MFGIAAFAMASVVFGPAIAASEEKAEEVKVAVASANPLTGDPAAIEAGKDLYFTFCVQCHGHKADGESRFGKYAYDLRKFWRGYDKFVELVLVGRPKKMMPPWGGYLDEDQINQIGAYLETLAIEGAKWD